MSNRTINDFDALIDDLEEIGTAPKIKNYPHRQLHRARKQRAGHTPKKSTNEVFALLADQDDTIREYEFSYNASFSEKDWIVDSLGWFYEQQWFDDITRLLEGGKEASVYQCHTMQFSEEEYLAAKIYRPRKFRQLKNDHLYREGRARLDANGNTIIDGGMHHAMDKRTEYGRKLMHTSWIEHEFKTMQILHAAGADVPEPFVRGDNAILMEYIGGDHIAAPTMNNLKLDRDEAKPLFERVIANIELMLAHDRVHGDLSAFNILYWQGEITIIDFPQAIHPEENRSAYHIFERDVSRVCEYFARQGVHSQPRKIAADMWTAHKYKITPDIHPRDLDDQDDGNVSYWQALKEK